MTVSPKRSSSSPILQQVSEVCGEGSKRKKEKKLYSQFLMSEMKTANPRIPSPFDTAGMFAAFSSHSGLIRGTKKEEEEILDLPLISLSTSSGAKDEQLGVS